MSQLDGETGGNVAAAVNAGVTKGRKRLRMPRRAYLPALPVKLVAVGASQNNHPVYYASSPISVKRRNTSCRIAGEGIASLPTGNSKTPQRQSRHKTCALHAY